MQQKLTVKQRKRLTTMEVTDTRVIGWSEEWSGPIIRTPTGAELIVTRDGGIEPVRPAIAA